MISLFQDSQPGVIMPNHPLGWLAWLGVAAMLAWGIWRWRENLSILRERWWLVLALLVAAPLFASILGIRLPVEVQPMPETPMDVAPPALMFLAAVPWILAGGLLGAAPAAVLGILGGLMLAIFETHSPFTPLEIGALALLFGAAVRQNYRTRIYKILRHPLVAALVITVAYAPALMVFMLFSTRGDLAARLDYVFTQAWLLLAARAAEIFLAGLAAEMIYLLQPGLWGRHRSLIPSPSETSIQARFFYGTAPLVGLLVLSLIIGDWLVAGNTARRLIRERLSSTAQVAAETLPYFLETGQNLILSLSSPDLLATPDNTKEIQDELAVRLRSVPYFRQLVLYDANGDSVSGFPVQDPGQISLTEEEKKGIPLALKGVSTQVYVVPPLVSENSAQVSFIAAIRDNQGTVVGALLGRTDLNTNPFTQPAINALKGMNKLYTGGQGMILNEKGIILYHQASTEVMSQYLGHIPVEKEDPFFDDTSPTNTRQFVYYQKVNGRPWAVVLTVPAKIAQQFALDIAIPLLVMLLVFSALVFIFLRLNLLRMTSSLQSLSQEAYLIAQGQLNHLLKVKGVDEVGQLSQVFEQMRISLKARLEELNSLLQVSQGVAANLDISDAIRPILEAALVGEACSARLVFVRDVTLEAGEQQGPVSFGVGPAAQLYANFDQQIFEMMRQQDILSLPNVARMRRLQFAPGAPHPGAVLALAVHREERYYGALWVAYDHTQNFSEEEIRFLTTLSSEAALAATSARLYATAEVGRQRLEAVLASTPEPVLVTDENARLLLLNPAAVQVPGLILSAIGGRPIQEVVGPKDLVELLTVPLTERISSREISLANNKVFYASVSPVVADGRSVGRVCTMRDITHYKELEQLKSDFVATVSHDLRSPLTLMRGYATMLQMVGELNDQQKGYVRKIVSGVENMTRLVNNLLDLGRIETGIGLQIERVLVNEIAGEVINSLQLQAVQKDIRLSQEMASSNKNLVIEADRALIQQAMYNLVENAIKYTAVGGQVKMHLESRNGSVLVEVHDTGIGIAPLDLPHLFEKFYRSGRREAYQQRGTGLGLAIVKSIAERHGGRVWVDSQLGKGSVFCLEVPCEQYQKSNGESG
jgi:PAS domain S-box-containing protein